MFQATYREQKYGKLRVAVFRRSLLALAPRSTVRHRCQCDPFDACAAPCVPPEAPSAPRTSACWHFLCIAWHHRELHETSNKSDTRGHVPTPGRDRYPTSDQGTISGHPRPRLVTEKERGTGTACVVRRPPPLLCAVLHWPQISVALRPAARRSALMLRSRADDAFDGKLPSRWAEHLSMATGDSSGQRWHTLVITQNVGPCMVTRRSKSHPADLHRHTWRGVGCTCTRHLPCHGMNRRSTRVSLESSEETS